MAADLVEAIVERIDDYPGLAEALGHTENTPKRFKDFAAARDVSLPLLVFQNVAGRPEFDARYAGFDHSYWDFHVYSLSDAEADAICKLVRDAFTGWTDTPDDGPIKTSLPTYHRESVDEQDGPDGRFPVFHHQRTFHFIQVIRGRGQP